MGVKEMVVVINKMDAVKWSEARYKEIKREFSDYLKKIGYNPDRVPFVPISGWHGDNLCALSDKSKWYTGPTVTEALE